MGKAQVLIRRDAAVAKRAPEHLISRDELDAQLASIGLPTLAEIHSKQLWRGLTKTLPTPLQRQSQRVIKNTLLLKNVRRVPQQPSHPPPATATSSSQSQLSHPPSSHPPSLESPWREQQRLNGFHEVHFRQGLREQEPEVDIEDPCPNNDERAQAHRGLADARMHAKLSIQHWREPLRNAMNEMSPGEQIVRLRRFLGEAFRQPERHPDPHVGHSITACHVDHLSFMPDSTEQTGEILATVVECTIGT